MRQEEIKKDGKGVVYLCGEVVMVLYPLDAPFIRIGPMIRPNCESQLKTFPSKNRIKPLSRERRTQRNSVKKHSR